MTYRCIAQLQEKADNTALLCRLLGVSRSGFYAACSRRGEPARVCPTSTHLRAAFTASGRCYGSRRLRAVLHAQGLRVGRYRIRTLMRINGLRPVWRRKFIHTTDSRHGLPIADNVLNRHFTPATANAAWVSDITYIRTRSGWLYLAAVLDLYSRRIVGWSMQESMTSQLVVDALMMAVWRRGKPVALLHHSDQGSQYTSEHFQKLLDEQGITCSMSRAGEVWDNSAMESFFSSLKTERTARKVYRTRGQARSDVFDCIECFYNPTRRHSTLDYLSPVQFEKAQEA